MDLFFLKSLALLTNERLDDDVFWQFIALE